jgi:hypothetical protein
VILCVEASLRDPGKQQVDNLAAVELSADPIEAVEKVRRFLASGYWVEVFSDESKELIAGPFNPDEPAPAYID